MKPKPTPEQVSQSFARLSPEDRATFIREVITSPEWIANSTAILREIHDEGLAEDEEMRPFIHMLERSAEAARYIYGRAVEKRKLIELAEEVKFCRKLNPAKATEREILILSRYLQRVKTATDNLDIEFFRELCEAVELVKEARIPPASRESLFIALTVYRLFLDAGLQPTKADVKREVQRYRKILKRIGGADGTGATVLWQRDIWTHPELLGLKERVRGEAPVYMPASFYQHEG